MGKVYVRVDDRLIHGQTVLAWCPTLSIQEIIAIDNDSASNPMLRSIMEMGVPKNYATKIVTIDQAKELLKEDSSKTRLVIVKYPSRLMEIQEEIAGCEFIILGNIAKRNDSVHQVKGATGIFFLSEQDVKDIDSLVEKGFKVDFQQLPNAAGMSWSAFKKTI